MTKILLILGLVSFSFQVFAQDVIIRKNGTTIDCEVIDVDSSYVNFKILHGDSEVQTRLKMDEVEKIVYEGEYDFTTSDTPSEITIKKGLTTRYYHQGVPLTNPELAGLLSLNKAAHAEYKKSKGSMAGAMILSFAGGFCIGWPIGTAIAGGDANWTLAAIGGGLILLSIPFTLDANKKVENAIDIYNGGLSRSSSAKPKVLLGFSPNGAGIRLVF